MQLVFARPVEHSIDKAEIVFAFRRLDPIPADPHSTVLRFNLASCGHTVSMYARSDEAVLSVSPERTRYGLPSTINCVAAPRFSRWAMDESAREGAVASESAAIAARVQGMWGLMGGIFLREVNRRAGGGAAPWVLHALYNDETRFLSRKLQRHGHAARHYGDVERMNRSGGRVPDGNLARAGERRGARLGFVGFVEEEINFAVLSTRWMYLMDGHARVEFDLRRRQRGDDAVGDFRVGSTSVAKLKSGGPPAFRKVLSTTIVGVRPTKMTLPPAAAKARRRSSTAF